MKSKDPVVKPVLQNILVGYRDKSVDEMLTTLNPLIADMNRCRGLSGELLELEKLEKEYRLNKDVKVNNVNIEELSKKIEEYSKIKIELENKYKKYIRIEELRRNVEELSYELLI